MTELRPFWLILSFLILESSNLYSQSLLFSSEKYISEDGGSLNYRQLVSGYDSISVYPLVIFLHGSGERGDDNEAQLKWGVQNFATQKIMKSYKPIVIAPQCPNNSTWANFSNENMALGKTPTEPMKLLRELLEETIENMPIDTSRIYITGLSMGGFGTFDAISRYPDLFAAAVPVCGGGDVSKASSFASLPIWIFHGAQDTVVDSSLSRNMVKALTEAGGHPGYTQYPETGHFSWIAAYSDEMMMEWLFSQSK